MRHVLRRHHAAERDFFEILLLHLGIREAELGGAGTNDAFDARALDDSGQDRVHGDARGAELLGEALGEADDAELRRRIGRAVGVAMAARRRGHVDDGAAAVGLEKRHGPARTEELAGEVDIDAAPPGRGIDLLDRARRAGDAGIVDQHVEAAERARGLVEQSVHLRFVRDVGPRRADPEPLATGGERGVVHVADMHARACPHQGGDDGEPDPPGAGGDDDPLAFGAQLGHGAPPLIQAFFSRSASTAPSTTRPKMMSRIASGSVVPASNVESAVSSRTPPSIPT